MHKNTYDKHKKALLLGDNFATTALAQLEMKVMGYVTQAVTQYQLDGNIDHVKAGAVLLEGFNPKWSRIFFKAMRRIRALHTDFKIVVTPDAIAFTYSPIAKDKRPDTLPELQVVLDEMLSEFLSTKRSRDGKTDQEKEEAAVKGLITSIFKAGRIAAMCQRLSVEELQGLAGALNAAVAERVVTKVEIVEPAAPAEAEPESDDRNTGTDSLPATTQQIAELVAKMEA